MMKNVFWLASWFPSEVDPLTGDFIERHARAASLHNNITVIFVVKDRKRVVPGKVYIERKMYSKCLETVILYYKPFSSYRLLEAMVAGFRYLYFFRKLLKTCISEKGVPDLLNVHICYRAGLAALYCKWRYKLKYIVSEHWSVLLPNARPGYDDLSFAARKWIRLIYTRSWKCSAVSRFLATQLREKFGIPAPVHIPNVVDTTVFRPAAGASGGRFRFIHVSTLRYQKNPIQLIEAVRLLKDRSGNDFEMLIYGPRLDEVVQLVRDKALEDVVVFRGEVFHDILSMDMRNCDALVLNSRFETFGCVVIEAIASGLPVIVSDIPPMREIVIESALGVFTEPESIESLASQMLWMKNNRGRFDSRYLHEYAHRHYSFEAIGKKFDELYRDE